MGERGMDGRGQAGGQARTNRQREGRVGAGREAREQLGWLGLEVGREEGRKRGKGGGEEGGEEEGRRGGGEELNSRPSATFQRTLGLFTLPTPGTPHPAPHTLLPTPYPHPAPHTLLPTPYPHPALHTQQPTPDTLHSVPYTTSDTRHATRCTQHSTPDTRHPVPYTLHASDARSPTRLRCSPAASAFC
jgi:hypothetical protein